MDMPPWGENINTGHSEPVQHTGTGFPPAGNSAAFDADYPFEEPEQAPELRSERSENLYSRSEPFWDRVVELPKEGEEYPRDPNYWNHPESLRDERILHIDSDRLSDKVRKFLGSRALWITLAVIALIVVVGLTLHSSFLQVKRIEVVGNARVSAQEVIELSQLKPGMSTLSINQDDVIQRISRNRYLRCTLVDVAFDTVTIHVVERVPVAYIQYNGRIVKLDNRGWVLEVSQNLAESVDGLIHITGLDVSRASAGQAINLRTPAHLQTYTQILVELKAMKKLDMIGELDMAGMDSITMKTREDGFTILLGSAERIHEKLRAATIVHEVVLEKGYYGQQKGGTIVVTDPESPSYMPPGVE